jgi:hypothetical protein
MPKPRRQKPSHPMPPMRMSWPASVEFGLPPGAPVSVAVIGGWPGGTDHCRWAGSSRLPVSGGPGKRKVLSRVYDVPAVWDATGRSRTSSPTLYWVQQSHPGVPPA